MSEPIAENDAAPIVRGYRIYDDGSMSPVERWVKHADGDWVSLDSSRRTSGDILMDIPGDCECRWDKVHGPRCPDCGGATNREPLRENWFREEYERAKARTAELPTWARPVVAIRPPQREHQGCQCGHPGAGCYCGAS